MRRWSTRSSGSSRTWSVSREAEDPEGWLEEALSCGVVAIGTFGGGLKGERDTVEARFLCHGATGRQTEGQINRSKPIKKQTYRRASFELLRRRFLGAA